MNNAIYRFTTQGTCRKCGKLGQAMGGYVFGTYSVLDALLWALEDLMTGERTPFLVAAGGYVYFDAAKVRTEVNIFDVERECTCI